MPTAPLKFVVIKVSSVSLTYLLGFPFYVVCLLEETLDLNKIPTAGKRKERERIYFY